MRALILLALLLVPLSAGAADKPSVPTAIITGVGAVIGTVIYGPVKVAMAVTGLALGIVLHPFSTTRATSLIEAATCGDYVITDSMLRGEERLCYWYVESCGPYE